MKKIIRITESDINLIVRRVLNENVKEYINIPKVGCEKYKKGCDPYSYLKVVNYDGKSKYFFKKEDKKDWVEAEDITAINAIKNSVDFKKTAETKPVLPKKINFDIVKGTKIRISKKKLFSGLYSHQDFVKMVNDWVPTYDFELLGDTYDEQRKNDWKKNVDDPSQKYYNWRNRMMKKITSNKKEVENDLMDLTNLMIYKLESDYEKRWGIDFYRKN
jgi:hypothetical protein